MFKNSSMNHKELRKLIKKFRRKKIRQKRAQERDAKLKEEEEEKLKDAKYQLWLIEQETLRKCQEDQLQHKRELEEIAWLEREKQAQIKFEQEKIKKLKVEEIEKKLETVRQIKIQQKEERHKLIQQIFQNQNELIEKLVKFSEDNGELPIEFIKSRESNPDEELCIFFNKTAACRHGQFCNKNHVIPSCSRILLLRNLFHHISLNEIKDSEHGNDISLEITDNDMEKDYEVFFYDILTELEKFGHIINFRTCKNFVDHLKGNVYVEYENERSAMKAFLNLQGRFYANKQVNVEFCNISWKSAICGLSFSNNCLKGKQCNFLHILKNPGNKYNKTLKHNVVVNNNENKSYSAYSNKNWDEVISNIGERRNWRWSESPEKERVSKSIEINNENINDKKDRAQSTNKRTEIVDVRKSPKKSKKKSKKKNKEHKNYKLEKTRNKNKIKNKHKKKKRSKRSSSK